MCFTGPKWKREVIPDHKFDFVDTRDFHSTTFGIRMRYIWVYVLVIKSFLVYVSDIFTAVTMLSTDDWSNQIFATCPKTETNGCVFIPFQTAKWLFVGCIGFSFLLLAYEARKSKKIIASRDISYAFTNVMANNYYSLRSYDHFCFFCHINDSTRTMDNFAFFVFFTFKEWKRLLLADGPRQAINGLTLYAIFLSKKDDPRAWYDVSKYTENSNFVTIALMSSTLFTVLVFAGSLLLLIAAAVCYIPLLCHIRGNLKEYCCHKVDKRIAEVVKKKAKQRLQAQAALAKKEAAGDFSHYKNKKGQMVGGPLPQPTLPNISVDDELEPPHWQADHKSDYQSSVYSGRDGPGPVPEYPPMPMYGYNASQHSQYPSASTLYDGSSATAYDAGSTYEREGLAAHAAPPAGAVAGAHNNHYSPPAGAYDGMDAYDYNAAYDYQQHPQQQYDYSQQQQQQSYDYAQQQPQPPRHRSPGPDRAYGGGGGARTRSPGPERAYGGGGDQQRGYNNRSPGPDRAYGGYR